MSPINSDLSGLPQGDKPAGRPPVDVPLIVDRLALAWHQLYLDDGNDELAMAIEGARWRASWSGMCARAVGYEITYADQKRALGELIDTLDGRQGDDLTDDEAADLSEAVGQVEGFAPSDPHSISDHWRFGIGSMTHAALQAVIVEAFPDAEAEVKIKIDTFGAAHADLVINEKVDGAPFRTLVEIKTTGGFAFKLMSTAFKGAPEGPRSSAVTQGAVAAQAIDADRLIIGYLSLECLSPDIAAKNGRDEIGRFAAEFHYTREEYEPIAERELRRVRRILEVVDAGELPPRSVPDIPAKARIDDPLKSAWTMRDDSGAIVMAGQIWGGQFCKYCQWQGQCLSDGPS